MSIGDALRLARKKAGMSQQSLANAIKVHQSSIAQLETGKRNSLSHEKMSEIEKVLGLTPGSLASHLKNRSHAAKLVAEINVPDFGIVWGNRIPPDVPEPMPGATFKLTGRWPAGTFVLKVSGHSVFWYGVHDGDVIAVRPTNEPENGSLVIARIGNAYTIKGYRDGKMYSFSPKDGEPVEMDQHDEYQIVGVMIGLVDGERRFSPRAGIVPKIPKRFGS